MKWDAYHAYIENETPQISFSIVHKKSFGKEDLVEHFSNCVLVTNKGEIMLKYKNIISVEKEEYFLSTLVFELPLLEKGKYTAFSLNTSNNRDKLEIIDIGRWIIDIVELYSGKDLSFGKDTFIDTEFEYYKIEVINNSNFKIVFDDLKYDLSNEVNYSVKTGKDYNSGCSSNDLTIEPKGSRTLCFNFIKEESFKLNTCVSIRPVLTYTIENEKKQIILNTSYYPPVLDKYEAMKLLRN
jgi:hypothetical protein